MIIKSFQVLDEHSELWRPPAMTVPLDSAYGTTKIKVVGQNSVLSTQVLSGNENNIHLEWKKNTCTEIHTCQIKGPVVRWLNQLTNCFVSHVHGPREVQVSLTRSNSSLTRSLRPLSEDETRLHTPVVISCNEDRREVLAVQNIANKQIDRTFAFDKVLSSFRYLKREERDGVGGEERTQIRQRKGFRRFPQRAQGWRLPEMPSGWKSLVS
ncbi:hypothetical protein GLYMA_14G019200v4 [Glycine max]|nr:hypothetical protein GLYMA_14G019200v4 [Glycine max]KAH1092712.1 hypothetical protein GYH30_038765 [Glycine max]KAH1211412.1 Kinesin-like protein KIN-5D [Glycine max]